MNSPTPTFDIHRQLQLTLAYTSFMTGMSAVGTTIGRLGTDISPANLQIVRAQMQQMLSSIDHLLTIANKGGIVTNVMAANKLVQELTKPGYVKSSDA